MLPKLFEAFKSFFGKVGVNLSDDAFFLMPEPCSGVASSWGEEGVEGEEGVRGGPLGDEVTEESGVL